MSYGQTPVIRGIGRLLGITTKSVVRTPVIAEGVLYGLTYTQTQTYLNYSEKGYGLVERNGYGFMVSKNKYDKLYSKIDHKENVLEKKEIDKKVQKINKEYMETRKLQVILKSLDAKIVVDGVMGKETRKAVEEIFNVDSKGLTASQTLAKIKANSAIKVKNTLVPCVDNSVSINQGDKKINKEDFFSSLKRAEEQGCKLNNVCIEDEKISFEISCKGNEISNSYSIGTDGSFSFGFGINNSHTEFEFKEGKISVTSNLEYDK
jgi:hypothetical protein